MPKQYEAMRDKFAREGMDYDAAQGKAARIYNSRHPGAPVTGNKEPKMNKGYSGQTAHYAQGGAVLGKESSFMKTPDQFRDDRGNATDENWGKNTPGEKGDGGPAAPAAKSKSLKAVKPRS